MVLTSQTLRLAYAIYGTLCLLVVGMLVLATAASLSLEDSRRRAGIQADFHNRVRLAMSQMEKWANPLLFNEFQRDYSHYAPFFLPSADQVRLATGEMLAPGSIIQPSPLLANPPQQPWILLHFQASAQAGFRSPQVIPENVRYWPGFAEAYDTWDREPYARTLSALEYAYTPDDLGKLYYEALDALQSQPIAVNLDKHRAPEDGGVRGGGSLEAADHLYNRERINTARGQWNQTPPTACEPKVLADANLLALSGLESVPFANDGTQEEDRVAVESLQMLPIWLQLPGHSTPNLVYLRALSVGGETSLQGFIIDWSEFREELVSRIRFLFPQADLVPADPASSSVDETILSLAPIKLKVPAPDLPKHLPWSTTHTFLVVGWCVAGFLLVALGFGLRSLVTLSERRSQFACAVTHELRTPLTTFRLYTDMLAQDMVAEENKGEYLKTINEESKRLADLVSGVLEYSRVENRSVPVAKEDVRVFDILESIKASFAAHCANSDMTLTITADSVKDDWLRTDARLVSQIIGNLIDNACKYGRSSDRAIVEVSVARKDSLFQFHVRDYGPGVPARMRAAIFRPYQRAGGESAPATGGIGLGLALSRSWAKLLGGRLELVNVSRGGVGACFCLTLPA